MESNTCLDTRFEDSRRAQNRLGHQQTPPDERDVAKLDNVACARREFFRPYLAGTEYGEQETIYSSAGLPDRPRRDAGAQECEVNTVPHHIFK